MQIKEKYMAELTGKGGNNMSAQTYGYIRVSSKDQNFLDSRGDTP